MSLLLTWILTTGAVLIASKIVPGVQVRSVGTAIAVAAVFGLLNTLLGGVMYVALGVVSLGLGFLLSFLTRWLVNTVLLRLTDALFDGFRIPTWGLTAVVALIIFLVGAVGRGMMLRHY